MTPSTNAETVFVYEFVTGGGWWSVCRKLPPTSLLREGQAMVRALVEDFSKSGRQVIACRDVRLPSVPCPASQIVGIRSQEEERTSIARLAAAADAVVVIAPEFDGRLCERVEWVEAASGGRLLSPDSAFVRRASDKFLLNGFLSDRGIPVPRACWLPAGQVLPRDFDYPAIVKRRDGAGSLGVQRVASPDQVIDRSELPHGMLLESFCPGQPASIAILCGPAGSLFLPAAAQCLSSDDRFIYLGGRVPLEGRLAARAEQLARRVLDAMPRTVGYVGIDLVLGECQDEDRVIEVNPRLTTSYVGLRQLAHGNLADAMWRIAGGDVPTLEYRPLSIRFEADGRWVTNDFLIEEERT